MLFECCDVRCICTKYNRKYYVILRVRVWILTNNFSTFWVIDDNLKWFFLSVDVRDVLKRYTCIHLSLSCFALSCVCILSFCLPIYCFIFTFSLFWRIGPGAMLICDWNNDPVWTLFNWTKLWRIGPRGLLIVIFSFVLCKRLWLSSLSNKVG